VGDAVRVASPFGQGIALDGDGDYVIHDIPQTTYANYSVSFWTKASSLGQAEWSSLFSNNSGGIDFQVDMSGNALNTYRYISVNEKKDIGQYNLTDWIHIAVICNGNSVKLYFNGVHVITATSRLGQDFGEFVLGTNRDHVTENCFHGVMDELRIYDRVLNADELMILSSLPNAFEYRLTVIGGAGYGDYSQNENVSISANPANSGYQFVNWQTSDGGSFANASEVTTSFTMPANNVSITAIYIANNIEMDSPTLQKNADGSVTLSFESGAGRSYRVEYSYDLENWSTWPNALPTGLTSEDVILTDDGAATGGSPSIADKRFYRIIDITEDESP